MNQKQDTFYNKNKLSQKKIPLIHLTEIMDVKWREITHSLILDFYFPRIKKRLPHNPIPEAYIQY